MVSYPGSVPSSVKPGLLSFGFGLTRHNHLTKVSDVGCLEHHTHGYQGTQGAEGVDVRNEAARRYLELPPRGIGYHCMTPLSLAQGPLIRLRRIDNFLCSMPHY
jgi:hypothetical protein